MEIKGYYRSWPPSQENRNRTGGRLHVKPIAKTEVGEMDPDVIERKKIKFDFWCSVALSALAMALLLFFCIDSAV